jgi:hypothetical protein
MELFNQYKSDLTALIQEIEQKMKESSNLNGGIELNLYTICLCRNGEFIEVFVFADDRRHAFREIENCFKEADELV